MSAIGSVPALPDPEAVRGAATSIETAGTDVVTAADDVAIAWGAIAAPDVYVSPEREAVVAAQDPPVIIAALVRSNATTAATALHAYADELELLRTRRTRLVADVAAWNDAEEPEPDDTGAAADRAADRRALERRVDALAEDADAADATCAAALDGLSAGGTSAVSRALQIAGGAAVGVALELPQQIIDRHRRYFATTGSTVVPGTSAGSTVVARRFGTDFTAGNVGGRPFLLPAGATLTDPVVRPGDLDARHLLVDDPRVSPGATVPGLQTAGRVLGAAGAVITVGATWDREWTEVREERPEYTTTQQVASAATSTAFDAGGAIAGGAIGAKLGAMAGSFIPIPVVGTVAGAVIGGAIGGIIGSGVGQVIGDALKDGAADLAEGAKDVLTDVGGGIADGAQKVWKGIFG